MRKFEPPPPEDPNVEPEEFEINRLILIGNGFDRAHNMPTSYLDFMTWYIRSMMLWHGTAENIAISVSRNGPIYPPENFYGFSLKQILEYCRYQEVSAAALGGNEKEFHELSNHVPYRFYIKSPFLHHLLLHCCEFDWVDIENEYYMALKAFLPQSGSAYLPEQRLEGVTSLNNTLSHLAEKLAEYLSSLPLPAPNDKFNKIFYEKLKQEDFIPNIYNTQIADTLIVNFNYTHTAEEYFKNGLPENKIEINHIHGEIHNTDNPIIFGFGDELDEDYRILEKEKITGVLDKMKSFGYFRNSNYRNLIRFIEAREFQVFVIGHSCGLSDRTMLNMIFEHPNCWSIKIFHHERKDGSNNYRELTQEISRHFVHKQEMRKRIVSFDPENKIPQTHAT